MNAFSLWFTTGLEHILDPGGYDHILFVTLLTLSVDPGEWKNLFLLVTAFTLGHCLTLALSVSGCIELPSAIVEFFIALSILLAGLFNLFTKTGSGLKPIALYTVTAAFGLLHGLGFSFLLRSMLGETDGFILPLVYFNLGIEAGQLLIVAAVSLISLFLTSVIRTPFRYLKFIVVCSITLISLKMCSERLWVFFA